MIIGAQLYTVRKYCQTLEDLDETLKKCAEMGYRAVQLSGVCDFDAEWMKEKLTACGLEAPITHSKYGRIIGDTDALIAEHKIYGAGYIGLGSMPNLKNSGCDMDVVENFIREVTPAAEKIAASGLKFMYHNHNMEFCHTPDGQVLLDKLAGLFPASGFGITLDCYWVTAGGGDPAWWLRRLKGQVDCVHFKDMVYSGADKAVRMAPVGRGNLNHDAILAACADAGVKYAFIEQDNCYGEDEFACLKESLDFLRRNGCKD